MGTVYVEHHYPVSAQRLWRVASDMSSLSATTGGLVRYRGLPQGAVFEGAVIEYQVSLLGLTPWSPYWVEVMAMDHRGYHFATREWGAGIRQWDHDMRVEPTADGSVLIEAIEVEAEAAWQTPLARLFAKTMYERRHPARLRLLDDDGPWDLAEA